MEEKLDVLNEKGEFTNQVATREECHENGYWHKAVVVFILNSKNQVLLQQRSATKKAWPNLWDITAGGHVLANEFGIDAVIRETKEEIGLEISKNDLFFIGATISKNEKNGMKDNHFNEYYIVRKEIDPKDLILQKEEVQDIKWFDKEEILQKIHNNYEDITDKIGCWEYLEKYLNTIS